MLEYVRVEFNLFFVIRRCYGCKVIHGQDFELPKSLRAINTCLDEME